MRLFATLLALLGCLPLGAAESPLDFTRDIRPILSENCFQCHGPDEATRMAGLRLDVREEAVARGAIAPGDPTASKLVARLRPANEALAMPPAFTNKSLSETQKAALERWIAEGAPYRGHWAYERPVRPAAPDGPAAIDFLVNRKLAERGLRPAGEADRRTLARRVSLDLTGLPPDPDVVEQFVADARPDAYARLVERYLASPHYGERMAVYWLDLVRYADTTGFHNDVPFAVHPYRDWVIEAFNSNMPFDRFTREQLAGDLLPGAGESELVASAYNRLGRLTTEGGAQAKEYLAIYAADRARTTATVWLGATMGCAECHDHKFDPYLTREFYELEAFFADIEEKGVFERNGEYGPVLRLLDRAARAEQARIDAELARLRAGGAGKLEASPVALDEFRRELRRAEQAWKPIEPARAQGDCSNPDIDGCENYDVALRPGGEIEVLVVGKTKPREAEFVVEAALEPGERLTGLLYEVSLAPRFDEFLLSEIRVELLGRGARPLRLALGALVPDEERPGALLRHTVDGNDISGWGGEICADAPRRALFELAEPLVARPGERLRVRLLHNGRGDRTVPGRFRLAKTDAALPELPLDLSLRNAVLGDGPSAAGALRAAFEARTGGNANWREIRALERRKQALWDHAEMCHVTRALAEPREIRVLPRGDWMNDSGEIVEPRPPRFLNPFQVEGRRATRLDLADWLTSEENPLTARVFVNRLWKLFFGVGLSKTLDDLGSQGEPPVNPELLDWLAVEFVESGWDVKHVVRTMLLSETYRRTSVPTAELREKDPFNRLHGRQATIRLEAESIRDSALKVSGLWNPAIGGPSVKPYQPAGYYQELNFPKREYEPDYDERQYRRGLYTHWQRTFLHPSLMAFDATPREECTAERTVSNTPLQALTLLNDPTYVEAARAFAGRIAAEGGADPLDWAFRQAFARPATAAERAALERLLVADRERFAADPEAAARLLSVGMAPVPEGIERTELAAWTSVARALLNKHEFVVRY